MFPGSARASLRLEVFLLRTTFIQHAGLSGLVFVSHQLYKHCLWFTSNYNRLTSKLKWPNLAIGLNLLTMWLKFEGTLTDGCRCVSNPQANSQFILFQSCNIVHVI